MTGIDLATILPRIRPIMLRGSASTPVRGVTYDSRRVQEGWLFCALPGIHADGRAYVRHALERGAAAVVHEADLSDYEAGACYVQVEDARKAMSSLAAALYGDPSTQLPVIGVTGTDGKSSTVFFIHQLLSLHGVRSGFLSTVAMQVGAEVEVNPFRQSTPESTEIHELLRRMVDNKKEVAVLEATSHGLSPRTARLQDVQFTIGVSTNVTHEHLEFHGTFDRYRDDKANLFRSLNNAESSFAVVNADDESSAYFTSVTTRPVLQYSASGRPTSLWSTDLRQDADGITFDLHSRGRSVESVRLNTPGGFNVENVLAALLASGCYLDPNDPESAAIDLAVLVPQIMPVKGRLSPVRCGQSFRVIVDYAHTPGAFARVLPMMRTNLEGRLIVVFGSGGERDRAKRPLQGKVAAEHAEIVVLSDEDPRGEDRVTILEEIAAGCAGMKRSENLFLIPDRREAIRKAFSMARADDLVLLLGKGHEYSIIYPDGPIEWDEELEARRALVELGYTC